MSDRADKLPQEEEEEEHTLSRAWVEESERTSLRDQLAMAALSGLLAAKLGYGDKVTASVAYQHADAMLAAREEGNDEEEAPQA